MASQNNKKLYASANQKLIVAAALLNYARLTDISDKDITQLYERIEKIRNMEDLDTIEKYDLWDVDSIAKLRERLNECKSKIANVLFSDKVSGADKMQTVVQIVMQDAGFGSRNAENMAQIIKEHKLDQLCDDTSDMVYADKLLSLTKNNKANLNTQLRNYFDTYKQIKGTDSAKYDDEIIDILPDIYYFSEQKSEIDIPFAPFIKEYGNDEQRVKIKEKNQNKLERRKDIRRPFTMTKRPEFIRLNGELLGIGEMLCEKDLTAANAKDIDGWFQPIENIVTEIYGKDRKDAVLGDMFENKTAALRFCQQYYGKFYTGMLAEKIKLAWNNTNSQTANEKADSNSCEIFNRMVGQFIKNMRLGQTNTNGVFPPEPNRNKEKMWDGSEDEQTISVHHKFTIAAAEDIGNKLQCYGMVNDSTSSCDQLVNQHGNFALIIGAKTHQTLEPKGNIAITAQKDNMIFAATSTGIGAHFLGDGKKKGILEQIVGKNLLAMIRKNVSDSKNNNGNMITMELNLPESPIIEKVRDNCRQKDKAKTPRDILGLVKMLNDEVKS